MLKGKQRPTKYKFERKIYQVPVTTTNWADSECTFHIQLASRAPLPNFETIFTALLKWLK